MDGVRGGGWCVHGGGKEGGHGAREGTAWGNGKWAGMREMMERMRVDTQVRRYQTNDRNGYGGTAVTVPLVSPHCHGKA